MTLAVLFGILLLQAAPDPSPEALALGRRLAETGTLAALLPALVAKDADELVGEHPELSGAEKAELRATSQAVSKANIDRLMTEIGRAYAETLTVGELKTLVAFNEGAAAKHWRDATPGAVMQAMARLGGIDLKKETRKAFCAKTGKLCDQD